MTMTSLPPELHDLLSGEASTDPYSYFGRYRDIAPVVWNPQWRGWIVTGYDEVREALSGPNLTSDRIARFEDQLTDRAGADDDANADIVYRVMSTWLSFKDGADHTRLRRLLGKPFSPRAVKGVRDVTTDVVAQLLDDIDATTGGGGGSVEVLHDFAARVPASVICKLMGIADSDIDEIGHWTEELTPLVLGGLGDADRHARAKRAFVSLEAYVRRLLSERRSHPGDDVISTLAQGLDEAGQGLSDEEIIAGAILLIFGGHETTMNLIANSLRNIGLDPAARHALLHEEVSPANAVEELLRFDGPTKSILRDVALDHELGGQSLKAGERVLLVLSAANHDPGAFTDPDRLDLHRSQNRHVAFGTGIHHCLGAPLARLEAQIAIPAFVRRFPSYEILTENPRWVELIMTRGLKDLEVGVSGR